MEICCPTVSSSAVECSNLSAVLWRSELQQLGMRLIIELRPVILESTSQKLPRSSCSDLQRPILEMGFRSVLSVFKIDSSSLANVHFPPTSVDILDSRRPVSF